MLEQERIGYVTDFNVDAITSSIEYCLNNLLKLKPKSDRACQVVLEKYTWDSIAAKLVDIYSAIVEQQAITICH